MMNENVNSKADKLEATGSLMAGKKGLVMGVANDHSIAWGIAKACAMQGAEIALTYQGEAYEKRVRGLASKLGSNICLPCNVEDESSCEAVFQSLKQEWGELDFLVHAIAFSDKDELTGRFIDGSRQNFLRSMDISCYSLTQLCKLAEPLLNDGGSVLTLSYEGAQRVMPNYNVMGVAKAALEASVRYLSHDLGVKGVRVNAISAGPMRTLAGSAVGGARFSYNWQGKSSALGRNLNLDDVGPSALYLLSGLGGGVTGEVLYVDGGYHMIGMAIPKS
ncbi:MAG: enoyl-ACP reductase [Alphaproteobacteria bacterium]